MQEENYNLRELFERINSGKATPQERELMARWLSRLDVGDRELSYEEIEARRWKLKERLGERPAPADRGFRRAWKLSAAAAVLFIAGLFIYRTTTRTSRQQQVSYREISTQPGQRKVVTLADSSRITLNNASHIRYPEGFPDSIREVYLEGGAFFDIAPDKEKPFVVNTGKLRVRVLGTSFDISDYPADEQRKVTVATGKVGVTAEGHAESWLLTPGEQLSYLPETGRISKAPVDVNEYTSWQSGELVFREETLEQICLRLERWYNVSIEISDPQLKKQKINLALKNESLKNVLDMVARVGNFSYRMEGRAVLIQSINH